MNLSLGGSEIQRVKEEMFNRLVDAKSVLTEMAVHDAQGACLRLGQFKRTIIFITMK